MNGVKVNCHPTFVAADRNGSTPSFTPLAFAS
jgi:hypothetical protein